MRFKFFTIPVRDPAPAEDELNRFLASVRIVHLHRHFVDQGENSFWTFAAEHLPADASTSASARSGGGKARIDYREVLAAEAFARFVRLREWRKKQAEAEGVPVYTLFTNEQLARIAESRPTNRNALKELEGIGEGKTGKYGEGILRTLAESPDPDSGPAPKDSSDETSRKPVPPDSGTR